MTSVKELIIQQLKDLIMACEAQGYDSLIILELKECLKRMEFQNE